MPLRPIDAIFVHPKRRLYVVYYRGVLWELPRMKIDDIAWQRRQTYTGNINELYLSRRQLIHDPVLAQKLRTLNLPTAVYGSSLFLFEAWWEIRGFDWLKDQLIMGQSPLAAHAKTAINQYSIYPNDRLAQPNSYSHHTSGSQATATDTFTNMLVDLAAEVMNHPL